MKQIDHDSQFTYNELQLFREIVFRRYVGELETQRPFKVDDTLDVFELVSPESEPSRNSINTQDDIIESERQGAGLYGWITSWFSGQQPDTDKLDVEDVNKAALLDMWPKMEFRQLPPNLRNIEKNIEAEILDVLSETWDDSTILRRDTLFAELVLQLDRMIIRFVDDDEVEFTP
jgi:hypothetical protein